MRAIAQRFLAISVVRSMAFVAITQIGNYALPLIAIPYLTRTLGPDRFGLISYAQVVIGYFTIIINYGFEMTATREISINRENKSMVSSIFSHVIFIKTCLLIISTGLLGLLLSLDRFGTDRTLYLTTHIVNVGTVLFPLWLFQGLEKSKLAAIMNFCVKLLFTISTFIVIKGPGDYILSNLLLSLSQVLVGIISIFIALRFLDTRFVKIKLGFAWKLLKEGVWVFCSTAIVLTYTTANIFILGLYVGKDQVGYFNVAYKIIFAVHAIVVVPVNLAFFPYIARRFHFEPQKARKLFNKAVYVLLAVTAMIATGLFIFAKPIALVFGKQYIATEPILRTMSVLPIIMAMVNIFGFNGLISLKEDRSFLVITAIGATLSIAMNCILIPHFGTFGVAWVWIGTEMIIFIACSLLFRYKVRNGKWFEVDEEK